MLLEINPDNPQPHKLKLVVDCLRKDGVIIYPTDTVYGIGCDIHNHKAIEKLCRIKGIKAEKTSFSFVFYDLKHISEYAIVSNAAFKLLKTYLPGPFTFIMPASSQVPKILKAKKRTIGIRIPENNIAREIVNMLGNPIITTSLKIDDDILEYNTNAELIYETYGSQVDMVIDGGIGGIEPSTIIDCTTDDFELIREGAGKIIF